MNTRSKICVKCDNIFYQTKSENIARWETIYSCGKCRHKATLFGGDNFIPWNKGKLYPAVTGSLNKRWKGGITPEHLKIRGSLEMKEWRNAVFKRDDYFCKRCDKRQGNINAHHIKHFADSPDLRFIVNNGITLCKKCHDWVHQQEKIGSDSIHLEIAEFMKKINPEIKVKNFNKRKSIQKKPCIVCGIIITKTGKHTQRYWNNKKRFCSIECRSIAFIGTPSPNKGKKFPQLSGNKNHHYDYNLTRYSSRYLKWQKIILSQCNRCMKCESIDNLRVISLKPFNQMKMIIDEGLVLCHKCMLHIKRKKIK